MLKICYCVGMLTCLIPSVSLAQQSLSDLLNEVNAVAQEEKKLNRQREDKFRKAAAEQSRLLQQALAEVTKQETTRDALRLRFDANENKLAELEEVLARRSGDLGELFGVFRQTADDAEALIYSSLTGMQSPQRRETIAALAATNDVPTILQIQQLWRLLLEEIAMSAEVRRFSHTIIDPDGTTYRSNVVRVGDFNVVSGDKYLSYLPSDGRLVELARQPAGYARKSAAALTAATPPSMVDFTVDPSRGALLGLLVQSPSISERIEQGGLVGYAIIAVGCLGLLVVFERILRLFRLRLRMQRQLKDMQQVYHDNPLGRVMNVYYQTRHLDIETMSRKLHEVVIGEMAEIKKGLPMVKVLAAVAPLMGLLGTVVGMIGTFQAITLFGTGDPKLMAGGISQALITTVLGLCAAIPLLLCHSLLSTRVTLMGKLISEQAAGLLAQKAEADAKGA